MSRPKESAVRWSDRQRAIHRFRLELPVDELPKGLIRSFRFEELRLASRGNWSLGLVRPRSRSPGAGN